MGWPRNKWVIPQDYNDDVHFNGLFVVVVIGESMSPLFQVSTGILTGYLVANFAAYTFAPPIMVTPLGALSVLIA